MYYNQVINKLYPVFYAKGAITSIYLGCKISPDKKEKIVERYSNRAFTRGGKWSMIKTRTAIEETTNRTVSTSGSDKVELTKKLNKLKAQDEGIHVYEEKIHHFADQMISINLDDGVKPNYEM